MAFMSKDGFKSTNRAPMRQHERSMAAKGGASAGLMGRSDPLQQPGQDGGGADEPEPGDMPLHTEHHAEGHHTTTHESGKEHDSQNLDELKQHLDKFLGEEKQEPSEQGEPEYE